jgi:glycosyltransferase involved in cell wall biosynthesis
MKIAIYNDWWSPQLVGGAEKTALEIAKNLAISFGEDSLHVFTLSNSQDSFCEIIDNLKVTRILSPTFRKSINISQSRKIFEKIRILFDTKTKKVVTREIIHFNPDVVILHNIDRLGLNFSSYFRSISKIPIVRVQHDLGDTCIYRTRMRKKFGKNCNKTCASCRIKENVMRNESQHYNLMLSVSQFVDSTFSKLNFKPQNADFGYPVDGNSRFELDHYSFDSASVLRLGFVGRVVPEKGIETILNSLSILNSDFGKIGSLKICGTGSLRYLKRLEGLASKLSINLELLGYQQAPFNYLTGKVDAVVVASEWQEPLGRVPLEAFAHGFPCFVSGIGGLLESKNFLVGPIVYFQPANAHDLAVKLLTALDLGIPITRPKAASPSLSFKLEKYIRSIQRD